jgi:hypothetical protein
MYDEDFNKLVAEKAYILWEQADCPSDRDQQFWYRAEALLRYEQQLIMPHINEGYFAKC